MPTEIARLMAMACKTVYNINKRLDNNKIIEQKEGSRKRSIINVDALKNAIKEDLTKSMHAHTKDHSVSHMAMVKTIKKLGGKSLVRLERPLLMATMKMTHLQCCKGLLNNMKSVAASQVIIFFSEKTFDIDPVHNHQNNHYISFGDVEEDLRMVTTMKHLASVMALGIIASNGIVGPLIWFPGGYRLMAAMYIDVLKANLLLWIQANFPDGNIVFQQDRASVHNAKTTQTFLAEHIAFWDKMMWPPYSPDANPLDFSFWLHIKRRACSICHPNGAAMKASVNEVWAAMDPGYNCNTCTSFCKRLITIIVANSSHIE